MTQPIRQQCYFFHGFKFGTFWKTVSVCFLGGTLLAPPVFAQVIPDRTLGKERSQVKTIDAINQRVEGGAARGSNLFHSFLDFNVAEGRGVYFANPQGIESILSRVTGQNPSHILGRLGVLGQADLYLLNPNGIVFGPNASLDIQGSFFGSTANSIALGEEGVFSAVAPQQSQLLSVRPQVGFLSQAADHPGSIVNQAQLTTGQDLSLTARQLDLQGQLRAGGNLTLQAADSLKIRDGETSPFVAAAGKNLLVQGNQSVDIFALNHPKSGFFSGRDMVLRSTNPVGGDAHYTSGGSFLVQQLNGEPGTLFSPYDPIIRSLGDVSFDNYSGSSLHILAAGSININTVIITGPEVGASGTDFIQEAVQLSDGSTVNIDGSSQPTLDIRAGVSPQEIIASQITGFDLNTDVFFDNNFAINSPILSNAPTSGNINIGDIRINPPQGLVYLTTQYRPHQKTIGGNITISRDGLRGNGIDARGFGGDGSSVILDSRGSILFAEGAFLDVSSTLNNAGSVKLFAQNDILFGPLVFINAQSIDVDAQSSVGIGGDISLIGRNITLEAFASLLTNNGGNVQVQANNLLAEPFSAIGSVVNNEINGGDITLQITNSTRINGSNIATFVFDPLTVAFDPLITSQPLGNTGNIVINTEGLEVIGVALRDDEFFEGFRTGGDITSDVTGTSNAGNIMIAARQISLKNGAQIRATTSGMGDAGNISIRASDFVDISGIILESNNISEIESNVESRATGSGGDLDITTRKLTLRNRGRIETETSGRGDAGNILIKGSESVFLNNGSISALTESANGQGGRIEINTNSLTLKNRAQINALSQNQGNSGNIALNIQGLLSATDSDITTAAEQASGGAINIKAGDIRLFGDSDITTRVGSGAGTGGDIVLTADSIIAFDDSDILAFARDGRGGDITLNTPAFFGENFFGVLLTGVDPDTLDGNDRVDINATGQTSGIVTVPDVSFIQNNLTELPENLVNPENLLANSCIVRTADQRQGKFIVTGPGGLPKRPGDAPLSSFPTGTIQTPTNPPTSSQSQRAPNKQSETSIVEPQGVYQLKNGRLVMSRECSDL